MKPQYEVPMSLAVTEQVHVDVRKICKRCDKWRFNRLYGEEGCLFEVECKLQIKLTKFKVRIMRDFELQEKLKVLINEL